MVEKKRRRIIYVDDVQYSLISVKDRLRKHFEVYTAQSAEALFELLDNIIPDLILLDINMPDTGGFAIIKTLNENPRFASLPIVFLTSQYDKKTVVKAMGLGAADLVAKPFNDADLINRIENAIDPQKHDAYKPVVLAVDDDPAILTSINELLHRQYKVYTLPKPEVLTLLLEKIEPDLFLLDCKMPVLNGFDLIPQIRAFPKHEETPILFLTSEGSIDNVSAAVYYGAVDFIVKPANEQILREKLALHTADYMLRRRLRAMDEQ